MNSQFSLQISLKHGIVTSNDEIVLYSLTSTSNVMRTNRERSIARNSSVNPNVLATDALFNLTYTLLDDEKDSVSSILSNRRDFYIRGNLKDLNSALEKLFFLPDSNYNGMDDLVFNLCDSGRVIVLTDEVSTHNNQPLCMNRTLPISINPINDPPSWRHPKVPVFVSEDSSYVFSDTIELIDVDSNSNSNSNSGSGDHELYVAIVSDYGTLSIDDLPLRLTLLDGTTGDHDSSL